MPACVSWIVLRVRREGCKDGDESRRDDRPQLSEYKVFKASYCVHRMAPLIVGLLRFSISLKQPLRRVSD